MRYLFAVLILSMLTFSCQKDETQDTGIDSVIGNWSNPVYTDNTITFDKVFWINQDSYLLSIKNNGKLVERKNSGWCGTPPISYADFEGTWSLTDSIITIHVGYWGGNAYYRWKVTSASSSKLEVNVLTENYSFPFDK